MSALSIPGFFDRSSTNIDPAMTSFFGGLERKQMEAYKDRDPYPLMYLDGQSQVAMGVAPGDLERQQAQYVAPSLPSPNLGAASISGSKAPPRPVPRSAPLATLSPGETAYNAPAPSSRTKSTGSKSGSGSGDSAPNIAVREDQSKRRDRRRKGSKSSEQDGDEKDTKRDSVLARNRVAALKCRRKKKVFVSDLEEQRIDLEQKRQKLQTEYSTLLNEVTSIKNRLMDHATCNDPHIDNWLDLEARRFVQTTKERYGRTYGSTVDFTYEELIDTAAPVASALSGPAVASDISTQPSSVSGSVVSPSSRRNSIAHSQGGVAPMAYVMQPAQATTWINPSELTMYLATHSAQTSPTMPNFDLNLSGGDGDGL
ncbi:hypothetical protein RB595_001547 [Gaeumannomyces hyphopodioides]